MSKRKTDTPKPSTDFGRYSSGTADTGARQSPKERAAIRRVLRQARRFR